MLSSLNHKILRLKKEEEEKNRRFQQKAKQLKEKI